MTTPTTLRSMLFLATLGLSAACTKQTEPGGAPGANPSGAPAPGGAAATKAPPVQSPDEVIAAGGFVPAEGDDDFTLAKATAGLGQGTLLADITTAQGTITCELFDKEAPRTVASFVGLARGLRAFRDPASGSWVRGRFFDGLAFHRVIPRFMIQGGDPLSRVYSNPSIGTGSPGFTMPDEVSPNLTFDRPGRLAMANSGHPTRAGAQFFITEEPKDYLNGGYVIFGQCDGIDVVKAITTVPVDSPRHNKPLEAVTMKVAIRLK